MMFRHHLTFLRDKTNGNSHDYSTGRETPNKILKEDPFYCGGQFKVQAYICNNCKTQYREYTKNGKHSFTLKLQKGKGYIKA